MKLLFVMQDLTQLQRLYDKSWETFHGHWCRTGDLFRVDEHGYYWFEGRADELLKVGGIWVAPLEVENCMLEHPGVAAVAVGGARQRAQRARAGRNPTLLLARARCALWDARGSAACHARPDRAALRPDERRWVRATGAPHQRIAPLRFASGCTTFGTSRTVL